MVIQSITATDARNLKSKAQSLKSNQSPKLEDRAKAFTIAVIQLTKIFPKTTEAFIFAKQIIRSSSSIGANLVEGGGSISKKEFINFRHIAKKSALETKYWLELIEASNLAQAAEIQALMQENIEIIKIISAMILRLKESSSS